MDRYSEWLVKYVVRDVEKEVEINLPAVIKKLVLVTHDEMTAQAHDTNAKRMDAE